MFNIIHWHWHSFYDLLWTKWIIDLDTKCGRKSILLIIIIIPTVRHCAGSITPRVPLGLLFGPLTSPFLPTLWLLVPSQGRLTVVPYSFLFVVMAEMLLHGAWYVYASYYTACVPSFKFTLLPIATEQLKNHPFNTDCSSLNSTWVFWS